METILLLSSFSYFMVDGFCGIVGGYNDFWMNLHHAIIFISYFEFYRKYA